MEMFNDLPNESDDEGLNEPSALIIVGLQNDYCQEEGTMSIDDAEDIIPKVNKLREIK